MLISKFNRMIRSKILWGCFAILISMAFVFTFSGGSGGCHGDERPRGDLAGRIDGLDIPQRDYLMARLFELGLRSNVNLPPEGEQVLRERVWQRLAALQAAAGLGIRVSDAEVATAIRRDQSFAENGQFSRERYEAVIARQAGVPVTVFETYLRQELVLQKLRELAASFAWVSPRELDQSLSDMTDRRAVEYVELSKEQFTPEVSVSTNEALAHYEKNQPLFEEPDRISVRYVRFALTNYYGSIELQETNIVAYYSAHTNEFTRTDTNDVETVSPLEDVRDEIVERMRRERALELAIDDATTFVVKLMPGRLTAAIPFETAAGAQGLAIHTTALFAATEDVPGLAVGEAFRRAAFDLETADEELQFSDAVQGADATYVFTPHERVAAHVPPFQVVKDAVFASALTNAQNSAFETKIDELRNELADSVKSGKTFREAAAAIDLNVQTTGVFSVYGGMDKGALYGEILPAMVMNLQSGEVSEKISVDKGFLVACVVSREPGEFGAAAMIRPQLASSLSRYRGGAMYRNWTLSLLEKGRFEDLMAPVAVPDESDDANDEEQSNAHAGDLL